MTECERIIQQGVLPESFFQEEEKCGFIITKERKKLWAIELDLLRKVDSICKEYGIKYYAMGGTLLGTVRHEGFIPWDDDIDIAMFRADYDSFCEIARNEMLEPYFLQSAYDEKDYAISHVKIRNSNTVGATKYDFEFDYNKGVFIDIFPIDNVPEDEDLRLELKEGVKKYRRLFDVGLRKFWYVEKEIISEDEKRIDREKIDQMTLPVLYKEFEAFCGKFNGRKTKECGVLALELTTERFFWNREDYNETIWMPFEGFLMPVPSNYDNILKKTYGNYQELIKGGALHGILLFDSDKSYKEYESLPNKVLE